MPNMGDGGLALGAALKVANATPTALPNAYLGFEAPRTDVFKAIKRNNLTHTPVDLERIADILCSGGVVARACGKMEWGPRALGNRSILAVPNDHIIEDRGLQRPYLRRINRKANFGSSSFRRSAERNLRIC